jgi:hypothetical protein
MQNEDRNQLLAEIAKLQYGDGSPSKGTSPVTLQVGYFGPGGLVLNNGILIKEAPATVIKGVMNWIKVSNDDDPDSIPVTASMYNGGLLVS